MLFERALQFVCVPEQIQTLLMGSALFIIGALLICCFHLYMVAERLRLKAKELSSSRNALQQLLVHSEQEVRDLRNRNANQRPKKI